jgi:quercetin dioxygenase-like cupin family protein
MNKFVFNDNVQFDILNNKSKRKVLAHSNNLMVVEVYFDKDGIGAEHTHPHEQITYVASGKFEFMNDGEKRVVCAGDSIHFAPNASHGTKCLEAGKVIDVFTPARKDFLK